MQTVWFNDNKYVGLGDIYKRFGYLNLKDDAAINMIDGECMNFLTTKLYNYNRDIAHFSYDLGYDKTGDMVVIKADNIVCALWFIGEFPTNIEKVLKENRFESLKYIYTFDEKSYKLKRRNRR